VDKSKQEESPGTEQRKFRCQPIIPGTLIILFSTLFLFILLLSGCSKTPGQNAAPEQAEKINLPPAASPPAAPAANFAAYAEAPVNVTPAVKPYAVAPDLSNITNKEMFRLSEAAQNLLIKNGFVVVPGIEHREFFALYEMNRYRPVPLFVTTDSLLHNYHLFFNHLLRVIETEKLAPELKELTRAMLAQAQKQSAALGSAEAYAILNAMGETDYRNYRENLTRMKAYLAGLGRETWVQNLYWGWLHTLLPLLPEKPPGYPSFMLNAAWTRKELNTFLGSWTELKHDTVLHAKPVYAEAGGGGENIDDRGYVEPNPPVYARLAALAKMTREGLQARGLLNDRDRESLERLEKLALYLKTIAEKELTNTPLTDEEYELIRSYGVHLERFWLDALRDEGIDHRSAIYDRPAALIADVATDVTGGRVLEEATGHIAEIYAAVPVDGKLRIAIGGVYSYYEFPWPLNDRLTDQRWHKMLESRQAPAPPEWTRAFTAS